MWGRDYPPPCPPVRLSLCPAAKSIPRSCRAHPGRQRKEVQAKEGGSGGRNKYKKSLLKRKNVGRGQQPQPGVINNNLGSTSLQNMALASGVLQGPQRGWWGLLGTSGRGLGGPAPWHPLAPEKGLPQGAAGQSRCEQPHPCLSREPPRCHGSVPTPGAPTAGRGSAPPGAPLGGHPGHILSPSGAQARIFWGISTEALMKMALSRT